MRIKHFLLAHLRSYNINNNVVPFSVVASVPNTDCGPLVFLGLVFPETLMAEKPTAFFAELSRELLGEAAATRPECSALASAASGRGFSYKALLLECLTKGSEKLSDEAVWVELSKSWESQQGAQCALHAVNAIVGPIRKRPHSVDHCMMQAFNESNIDMKITTYKKELQAYLEELNNNATPLERKVRLETEIIPSVKQILNQIHAEDVDRMDWWDISTLTSALQTNDLYVQPIQMSASDGTKNVFSKTDAVESINDALLERPVVAFVLNNSGRHWWSYVKASSDNWWDMNSFNLEGPKKIGDRSALVQKLLVHGSSGHKFILAVYDGLAAAPTIRW